MVTTEKRRLSTMNIETYESKNSPERRRWIAFIEQNGAHLPVWFKGATEEEARSGAERVWEENRRVREENIARREASRAKRKRKK